MLLLAAITSCARQPAAPSAADPDTVRRIVVLGDSLAVSPSERVNFPAELQALITERRWRWTVTNAGVASDTTAGGVRRVEGFLVDDVGVLILALGANDGLSGVPVDTIDRNLSRIIELAGSRHIRVLLCGMETPPTHGWEYSVAFHRVFPRLAQRHALPLVPFLLAGVVLVPDMNGPDLVHPNAAGARRIAQVVWPHLEPLLVTGRSTQVASRDSGFLPRRDFLDQRNERHPRMALAFGAMSSQ
jgi:acyl-CoA thioesterase-1